MNSYLIVLAATTLVLYLYWKSSASYSYLTETFLFFSNAKTPWLSSDQLTSIKHSKNYFEYVEAMHKMDVPDLIKDMLIGQPYKYMWRDRSLTEFNLYLDALSQSKLSYCDSIQGHTDLYTTDMGTWSDAISRVNQICPSK
jgi:hypothetical protein